MGPKAFRLQVTVLGVSGIVLTRPVTLTALRASDAKYRAGIVAVKPGQKVLNIVVVR